VLEKVPKIRGKKLEKFTPENGHFCGHFLFSWTKKVGKNEFFCDSFVKIFEKMVKKVVCGQKKCPQKKKVVTGFWPGA